MSYTLKDIAIEAGVSPATVSLVLNHRECRIADKTRKLIEDIAEKNHYVPNSSARALVMRQSQTLGLIIPDIGDPYFSELAKGVEREAQKHGYSIIFCSSDGNGKKDVANFKLLAGKQIDGLIIVTSIGDHNIESINEFNRLASECNIPVVQFDREIPGGCYNTISVDHQLGGYLATHYLITQGYRRIFCIAGPQDMPSAQARYQGYVQALAESNQTVHPDWVTSGPYTFDTGLEAVRKLLPTRMDAIFACNDLIACGVIRGLRERELRVGQDVALIGFDNSPICKYLDTPLTTIDQPLYAMGKSACGMLIKAINTHKTSTARQTLCFSPHLVIRETTRPCLEKEFGL